MAEERTTPPSSEPLSPGVLRNELAPALDEFLRRRRPVAPLRMAELEGLSAEFVDTHNLPGEYTGLVSILINNRAWRETFVRVPFNRRIFLIPQCLRSIEHCRAPIDEFGLLCRECGCCVIGELQREADALGYMVIVAEGTTMVTRMIAEGTIDAVLGISCNDVLEKAFPHMQVNAVPGMAVPLERAGCTNTSVDMSWVRELLHLGEGVSLPPQPNLDRLRREVVEWFTPSALHALPGLLPSGSTTFALDWLARDGKRWRPLLTAAVYRALAPDMDETPEAIRRSAVAVECFHKASLIHDDIEDDDGERYDRPTLHMEMGIPIALNTGDLLLGEGYRLLTESGFPSEVLQPMFEVAAVGHRDLAVGQGEELAWRVAPKAPELGWVLDMFRLKTAPAFRVALQIGALAGGADKPTLEVLAVYSDALGIGYQIRDDMEDCLQDTRITMQPTLALSLAYALGDDAFRGKLDRLFELKPSVPYVDLPSGLREAIREEGEKLLSRYRDEAADALCRLQDTFLKQLLHRITEKVLG